MSRNGYELRATNCALRAARYELRVEEPPFPVLGAKLTARAGFTLLELVLVLVVVGLGAGIAAARLNSMRETIGVEMAAQTLVDQARRSQQLAATSGQAVRLRIDLSARVLDIALMDGVDEQPPNDGEPAHVVLGHSTDDMTIDFARHDAVKNQGSQNTIDLLFTPDQRCDPAGTVMFTSASRTAGVRLSAGARLPARLVDAVATATTP